MTTDINTPVLPRPWGCRSRRLEDGSVVIRAYRWNLWKLAIILPITFLWNGFFWALFALSAIGLYRSLGGPTSEHLTWMLYDYGLVLPWGGSLVVTAILFIFILPGLMMIATAYDHLAGEVQVTVSDTRVIVEQGVWPAVWRDEIQRDAILKLDLVDHHDQPTPAHRAKKILVRTRQGHTLLLGQTLPRHRLRWLYESMLTHGIQDSSL